MKSRDFRSVLHQLNIDANEAIFVGSALMEYYGARQANDLDILVQPVVFERLAASGEFKCGERDGNHFCCDQALEIWATWFGDTFDDVQKQSIEYDGVRFASPQYTVRWKKMLGREKDMRDIQFLETIDEKDHRQNQDA